MKIRCALAALTAGVFASGTMAAVTEVSIFRQDDARSRAGASASPVVDAKNAQNTVYGPFADSQPTSAVALVGITRATGTASQNTNVFNTLYFGNLHGDSSATGNGTSDIAEGFGNASFSVSFTVDVDTIATFIGSVTASRIGGSTGTGGSASANALLLDLTNGANNITLAQVSASSSNPNPLQNFNRTTTLLVGHTYSFSATANSSANRTFGTGSPTASSDVTFWAGVPAPGASALFAMAGLFGARRRQR